MEWREEMVGAMLVSWGFTIFLGYHALLLYTFLKYPEITAFGAEIGRRRASVDSIFQVAPKDRASFTAELSSNVASVNTHSSLCGALVFTVGSTTTIAANSISVTVFAVALLALLVLLSGARNLQNAHFLIVNTPEGGRDEVPIKHAKDSMVRGLVLCEVGYRLFCFALVLLAWLLGPLLMFMATALVMLLFAKDAHAPPGSQPEPPPATQPPA